MKKLIIKYDNYSDIFIKNKLSKLIIDTISREIYKKDYNNLFEYINKTYSGKINRKNLIDTLKKGLDVVKINNYNKIIFRFDENIKINDTEYLIAILNLLNYGNLEIKGLKLIDNMFDYIKNNINSIYYLYVMKGDSFYGRKIL